MTLKRVVLLALSSALGTVSAMQADPAVAQIAGQAATQAGAGVATDSATAPAALPADTGDIVVTAQKRAERLNDVPMSINAASGAQLASAGIVDTSQLTKIAPGFTFQLSGLGLPVFGMRGISFLSDTGSSAPAVSVYVDQLPLPYSILSKGAALDIERVEVLKGPQGTLFGQNATGGAINYIAAKPTSLLSAGGLVTLGDYQTANVQAFVSGPLTDTLTARVAIDSENRGDWQYSTTRRDFNGGRRFAEARGLLDWKPLATLGFELNVTAWRDRSDTPAAQFKRFAPATLTEYQPPLAALAAYTTVPTNARGADWDPGFSLRHNDRFVQIALTGNWDVSNRVSLTSLSSYIRFRGYAPYDADGTSYDDIRGAVVDDFSIFYQELRLAGQTGLLRWMIGGNYQHDRLNEASEQLLESTNSSTAGIHFQGVHNINDQMVSTKAVFGSLELKLSPQLTIQGSARYTDESRDFTGCTADDGDGTAASAFGRLATVLSRQPTTIRPGGCVTLSPPSFQPVDIVRASSNDHNVSWRGSLNYEPMTGLLLYANATKGYKSGGYSTEPLVFTSQISHVTPESVLALEAGVKATLLDRRVRLNAAGFRYGYDDKQIQGYVVIPPFGNLPALVNVPKARIWGAEASIDWTPSSRLKLSASGTYVDARVTSQYFTNDPLGASINVAGEQLPNAPKWQFSANSEYSVPIEGDWSGFVGALASTRSGSYAAFGENREFRLANYALVDLRVGVENAIRKVRIEAFVRNLTDKYYLLNVSHTTDTVVGYAGLPRTFGVMLSYRF